MCHASAQGWESYAPDSQPPPQHYVRTVSENFYPVMDSEHHSLEEHLTLPRCHLERKASALSGLQMYLMKGKIHYFNRQLVVEIQQGAHG